MIPDNGEGVSCPLYSDHAGQMIGLDCIQVRGNHFLFFKRF